LICIDIKPTKNAVGIPKNTLKVGDRVGFKDKQNNDLFGKVIRLNPKRATIKINEHCQWLVHYSHLFWVIEGETGNLQEQTFIPRDL
jgi:ribosomal protein S1